MTGLTSIQTRSATRNKTRVYANIRYFNQLVSGRVIDLSATGMAIELDAPFSAAIGSRVKIESEDLGFIEGIVQWQHSTRLGLKLELSTNTVAQLQSYFRFFHQEVKPTFLK